MRLRDGAGRGSRVSEVTKDVYDANRLEENNRFWREKFKRLEQYKISEADNRGLCERVFRSVAGLADFEWLGFRFVQMGQHSDPPDRDVLVMLGVASDGMRFVAPLFEGVPTQADAEKVATRILYHYSHLKDDIAQYEARQGKGG